MKPRPQNFLIIVLRTGKTYAIILYFWIYLHVFS